MSLVNRLVSVTFLAVALSLPSVARGEEEEGFSAPADQTVAAKANQSQFGVGARVRYVTLPNWLLELFLDHATSMSSVGFGIEVVRRKGDFDIVFGLEYANVSAESGLYLEKGDDPGNNCVATGECPDDVVFDGLALIGFDASFIWHTNLGTPKVQLRYGAGIGVGIVLGDILQYDTSCPPGTTVNDLDDRNACPHLPGDPHEKADKPPVVPIVNVLLGLRFQVAPQLTLNLEGGFRNMFFLGVGTDYIF